MLERIGLGPAPAEEECVEIGHADYQRLARQECLAYIQAIKRVCGEPPEGVRFKITLNPHDFGSYLDVEVVFDADNQTAAEYAQKCEDGAPTAWEQAGMKPPSGLKRER